MKVYLDDEREAPEGWTRMYWPEEAIELFRTGIVEAISLDHDLGDDERGTGYNVVKWIEEQEECFAGECFAGVKRGFRVSTERSRANAVSIKPHVPARETSSTVCRSNASRVRVDRNQTFSTARRNSLNAPTTGRIQRAYRTAGRMPVA